MHYVVVLVTAVVLLLWGVRDGTLCPAVCSGRRALFPAMPAWGVGSRLQQDRPHATPAVVVAAAAAAATAACSGGWQQPNWPEQALAPADILHTVAHSVLFHTVDDDEDPVVGV